jgi:hypothetical protein
MQPVNSPVELFPSVTAVFAGRHSRESGHPIFDEVRGFQKRPVLDSRLRGNDEEN